MKVTGNKAYVKSDIDLFVNITGVVGKHRNHSYLSHGSNTKEGFGIKTLEDRYMSKFFNDSLNMMREAKEYMLSEANQAQEEGIIEENQGVKSVVQEVETPCAPSIEESKGNANAFLAAVMSNRGTQTESAPPTEEESRDAGNAFLAAVQANKDVYVGSVEYVSVGHGVYIDLVEYGESDEQEEFGAGLDDSEEWEEEVTEEVSLDDSEEWEGEFTEEVDFDDSEEYEEEILDDEDSSEEETYSKVSHGVYIDLVERQPQGTSEEADFDDQEEWEEETTEEVSLDEEVEELSEEVSLDEEMEESEYEEEVDLDGEMEDSEEFEEVGLDEEWEEETEEVSPDEEIEESEEISLDEEFEDNTEEVSLDEEYEEETEEVSLNEEWEEAEEEVNISPPEQNSKVVNFPGNVSQPVEAKKPEVKKEEEIPRDLRTYIKLHQGCSPADVIKLYSAKELQKALQIGKVYKRKGRLFV